MKAKKSTCTMPTTEAPTMPALGLLVYCNGWLGNITTTYPATSELSGMVNVRMERGVVCVSWSEIARFWHQGLCPLAVKVMGL